MAMSFDLRNKIASLLSGPVTNKKSPRLLQGGSGSFVIFDVETTGLIKESAPMPRIVEIALIEVDANCEPIYKWQTTINPEIESDPRAVQTHKLGGALLANSPVFNDIAPWLSAFLHGKTLVAHNLIDFDGKILLSEFRRVAYAEVTIGKGIDTLPRSRSERKGLRLDELRTMHGINKSSHQAMADCETLLELIRIGALKQLDTDILPFTSTDHQPSIEPPISRTRDDIFRDPNRKSPIRAQEQGSLSSLDEWALERAPNITLCAGQKVFLTGGSGEARSLMDKKHEELGLVSSRSISKSHIACVSYSLDSEDTKPRKAREQNIPFIYHEDFVASVDGKDIPAWLWVRR